MHAELLDVVCGRCRRRADPPGPPVCPTCGCVSSYQPGRRRPSPPPPPSPRRRGHLELVPPPGPLPPAGEAPSAPEDVRPIEAADAPAELLAVAPEAEDDTIDVRSIAFERIERIPTGFAAVDRVLAGGIARGLVTLIGGSRGVGKSRLLTQLLAGLAERTGVVGYYASREQTADEIARVADEVARDQVARGLLRFGRPASLPAFEATVRRLRPCAAVLDSFQTLVGERLDAQIAASERLYELAHSTGVPVIVVSQMNAEGKMRGSQAIQQWFDVIVALDRVEGREGVCVFRVDGKNRGAAIHKAAILHHEDNGLRAVEDEATP